MLFINFYTFLSILEVNKQPWFPRYIKELDRNANDVMEGGAELQADHPVNQCFSDIRYLSDGAFFFMCRVFWIKSTGRGESFLLKKLVTIGSK